jgi:hypothetical protein
LQFIEGWFDGCVIGRYGHSGHPFAHLPAASIFLLGVAAGNRKSSRRRLIFLSGGEVYLLAPPPVRALQANLRQDPKSLVW